MARQAGRALAGLAHERLERMVFILRCRHTIVCNVMGTASTFRLTKVKVVRVGSSWHGLDTHAQERSKNPGSCQGEISLRPSG